MIEYVSTYQYILGGASHFTRINVNNNYGIRPVININKNVTITGGNGSASAAFEISLSNN